MGRKIPGRKHRGIKDPFVQQAKRDESLKNKVNAPPEDPDDQCIPKSVMRIMELKKAVKEGKFDHKKKKKNKIKNKLINTATMLEKEVQQPGMTRPVKPVPVFQQRPGETNYLFLHRIDTACQEVLNENRFEAKFGVDVNRNPETGEVVSVTKTQKVVIEGVDNNTGAKKKMKSKKNLQASVSKKERRKLKVLAKKQKQEESKKDEFISYKDEVKFGEVAHQPPALKPPLKFMAKAKSSDGRPGMKDLLLKPLLETKSASKRNLLLGKKNTLDLTKRRKDIPVAERRQLEIQRLEAVKAYRLLKKRKLQNNDA